jgi:hypothetical protein
VKRILETLNPLNYRMTESNRAARRRHVHSAVVAQREHR